MGYNAIDILDKSIRVTKNRKGIFEKIEQENENLPSIKIMSKVFIKNLDKSIEYYEALRKNANNNEFEEIDFVVYDKISFLIDSFNKSLYVPKINDIKGYLSYSLTLEKDVYSLLVDVQGRLVKNTGDVNTQTYIILTDIIKNVSNYIASLEKILKQN